MPVSSKKNMKSPGQMMPPKLKLKLANECEKFLTKVKYNPTNKSYSYYMLHSSQIDETTYSKLFALFEFLMRSMYEKSSWGWNEEEKMSEWKHSRTRLIIVTKPDTGSTLYEGIQEGKLPDPNESIIAFMCYRFESGSDKSEAAFYVYELHVDEEHQRQGLGHDLMQFARVIAIAFKMDKIMLTVFRSNEPALKFYNKLKFKPDKSNPSRDEADYTILSSQL